MVKYIISSCYSCTIFIQTLEKSSVKTDTNYEGLIIVELIIVDVLFCCLQIMTAAAELLYPMETIKLTPIDWHTVKSR